MTKVTASASSILKDIWLVSGIGSNRGRERAESFSPGGTSSVTIFLLCVADGGAGLPHLARCVRQLRASSIRIDEASIHHIEGHCTKPAIAAAIPTDVVGCQ